MSTRNDERTARRRTSSGVPAETLKFPRGVFFIIILICCQAMATIGYRAIVALYLKIKLGYSEDKATVIYQSFDLAGNIMVLCGATVADACLGKYRTLIIFMLTNTAAYYGLFTGSLPLAMIIKKSFAFSSLAVSFLSRSFYMPCMTPFSGDQFVLPAQRKQLERYFSYLFPITNLAALVSTLCVPMLRNVSCMGDFDCYPLAYGSLAFVLTVGYLVFLSGTNFYRIYKARGKVMIFAVAKVISYAIKKKKATPKEQKRKHWLDHADDQYDKQFIEDTKRLLMLLLIFLPCIFYWALYSLQTTKWIFQASHMDGRIGSFVILPEQMNTLNPVLVLVMVPLFEVGGYPLLKRIKLVRTPLQKICCGGFMGAMAFAIAGVLQLQVDKSNPSYPVKGQSQLRVFNTAPCTVEVGPSPSFRVGPQSIWQDLEIKMKVSSLKRNVTLSCPGRNPISSSIELNDGFASSYLVFLDEKTNNLTLFPLELQGFKELEKLSTGRPKVKFVFNVKRFTTLTLKTSSVTHKYELLPGEHQTEWFENISTGKYKISLKSDSETREMSVLDLRPGGVYVLMISNHKAWHAKMHSITPPNNVHILWQIPQYVALTLCQVMAYITIVVLSYTEAPVEMKSLVSSFIMICGSLGNAIVIAGTYFIHNPAYEMFMLSGLMVLIMILFLFAAARYKYAEYTEAIPSIPSSVQPEVQVIQRPSGRFKRPTMLNQQ